MLFDICAPINRTMAVKPSIPKGTRDFGPEEVQKRNYIFQILEKNFQHFGFVPIQTPSFENRSTLTGKYGEEGDRLIFQILKSGDFAAAAKDEDWTAKDSKAVAASISDKALRYDLTVPFARYVVQHQNEITFPFKRYQIQPVWRADRPQKGRFREFYQCDADVVGSKSLWNEVDLIKLYDASFADLGLKEIEIHINNRKVLSGLAEALQITEQFTDLTIALDKLDKIGLDKVITELDERGFNKEVQEKLRNIWSENGEEELRKLVAQTEVGKAGLEELDFCFKAVDKLGLSVAKLVFNPTLARGLDYYTGAIFEVKATGVKMGSIGGGGRYDDLTGVFGLKDIPGVGISFGLDRIYLVMEELQLFPNFNEAQSRVLFMNFGEKEAERSMEVIQSLRKKGVIAELYPDPVKMKKQFAYADKLNFGFVGIIGEQELEDGKINLKNLKSGKQESFKLDDLLKLLNA